jgi:hypothetical protein
LYQRFKARKPHGPEAKGVAVGLRFNNRFKVDFHAFLHNPVPDGWNPKRALFRFPWLVDVLAAYFVGLVMGEGLLYVIDYLLVRLLEIVVAHCLAVNAWRLASLV